MSEYVNRSSMPQVDPNETWDWADVASGMWTLGAVLVAPSSLATDLAMARMSLPDMDSSAPQTPVEEATGHKTESIQEVRKRVAITGMPLVPIGLGVGLAVAGACIWFWRYQAMAAKRKPMRPKEEKSTEYYHISNKQGATLGVFKGANEPSALRNMHMMAGYTEEIANEMVAEWEKQDWNSLEGLDVEQVVRVGADRFRTDSGSFLDSSGREM